MRGNDDILFIAHVSPDGDTLGSCLALYHMALQMGNRAQVACEEPVPSAYRFLPGADVVTPPEDARQAAAVMCVDCADTARAGRCQALVNAAERTFCIDHHGTNSGYADGNYIEPAAATGELAYKLLRELRLTLTADIATCLFAAISSDTGNFSYANTTPESFRIAADLAETSIDIAVINRFLFRSFPYNKVMLRGRAITNMRLYCRGQLGMSILTQRDMRECSATSGDAEGIVDLIRDIDTVQIAVLLRESSDSRIRVSMRAKTAVNLGELAAALGGGGHLHAAGCTLDMPIPEAAERLRAVMEAALVSTES